MSLMQIFTCKFWKNMLSAHSRNVLMDSFPWPLRSYHELQLTALALESPFRAHGTCAVKIRKVTLGESLSRCVVALNSIADAQNCFREYSSGTANSKDCFQDCRQKMVHKFKGFNREEITERDCLQHLNFYVVKCELRLFC